MDRSGLPRVFARQIMQATTLVAVFATISFHPRATAKLIAMPSSASRGGAALVTAAISGAIIDP